MPRVKIDYIVSFSSEDPDNPASNLLSWELSKKRWLCAKGETSCSVVLQLTKAVKIAAVNIGAYNAAFVEVLVGRSEKPDEPFQVLVPSSVFLSPSDSRREGGERVRSFAEFGGTVGAQRWDRLRVVCTQPYNKHCKFGLSFIQITEPEGSEPPASFPSIKTPAPVKFPSGSSSEDESFHPGELFASLKAKNIEKTSTDTGSQIRQATSQALKNISDTATKLIKTPISKNKQATPSGGSHAPDRSRDSLLYTDDDDRPHAKIDRVVQRHKDDKSKHESSSEKKKRKETHEEHSSSKKARHSEGSKNNLFDCFIDEKKGDKRKITAEDEPTSKKVKKEKHDTSKHASNESFRKESKKDRSHGDDKRNEPSTSRKEEHSDKTDRSKARGDDSSENKKNKPSTSRDSEHRKKARKPSEKDVGSILSGVVLSLSGYVHPERGALRQLAIDMGARVERDWGPNCNVLVCAFPNTPKLKQVRSSPNGADIPIVTADWIKQAFATKRKPNWRRFATEPHLKDDKVDDSDSDVAEYVAENTEQDIPIGDNGPSPPEGSRLGGDSPLNHISREDKADDAEATDSDVAENTEQECDTDDEIEKVLHSKKKPSPSPHSSDGGDTDPDMEPECVESIDPAASLPAFFEGRTFVLSGQGPAALWARYVTAYGGLVIQESEVDADSSVDFILTADKHPPRLSGAAVVKPAWLWKCHQMQKLMPVN